MSFANSQSAILKWRMVVKFPTVPAVYTAIDIHDDGDIPILLSLPQMMNLGFRLEMGQNVVYLTSEALGYINYRVPFSTTRHLVIDLANIRGRVLKGQQQTFYNMARPGLSALKPSCGYTKP